MKICKDCVVENYETVESLITIQELAENLRDVEIGPSDDFV